MKLSDLQAHLLHEFSSEADLIRAIEEVSFKFTQNRERIEDYLNDPRLVSAYTAFYLTTNIPKLEAVMKWLSLDQREELKSYELVDLGAGPGTFSLAWKSLVGTKSAMIETSKLMREQAEKLFQGFYNEKALFEPDKLGEQKLMLFGHSLNEMGIKEAMAYVEKINPQKIWLLEPGTKQAFSLVLEFRKELLSKGWTITFPCPSQLSCPMQGKDDWCHQYLSVRHDQEVERLTQMAGKDRRNLPMTVHMYDRVADSLNVQRARIVRTLPATKFSFEWVICLASDASNSLQRIELPFKTLSKQEKKMVEEYQQGQSIAFNLEKELPDKWRISLIF